MKFYVVIDTNVLVSALLKSESNPGIIYKLVIDGIIIPLINEKIIMEYTNVLSRKKFNFSKELVDEIIETIIRNSILIKEDHIDIKFPDEKDRVFYEVTMKSNSKRESMLVTGNIKHFPAKQFIVTPKELCDIILEKILKQN